MTTLLTPISEQNIGTLAGFDEDVEPNEEWKKALKERVEEELQSMADKVRQERDTQLRGAPEGSPQYEAIMRNYQASIDRVRRIAQDQFNQELKIARFERSLALGKKVEGEEFEAFRRQQQAIWEAIKKGGAERPQGRRDSNVAASPNQQNGEAVAVPPRAGDEAEAREGSGAPYRDARPREPDVREGPAVPHRDPRPLTRTSLGSEPRPRDRTQSGGSDQFAGTPGSYGTRPARSRGNSSVFGVDFDPTGSSSSPHDQGSIGRQGLSSLSRTRPQNIWLPSGIPPTSQSSTSRAFAHAAASNASPVSPNIPANENGRTLSRAGSVRSIEQPSPVADFEPGSAPHRDRFPLGTVEERTSTRKGKEPDRSDRQRQPSFTQQTAVHDIYARRPDSRTTMPITPSRPTHASSEDQYFPQISPINPRYRQDPDEGEGIPIRSSRRSITSDQGSPENVRYGPPSSVSARPIPSKRSWNGDFDDWPSQAPSAGRPYYGPQSPPTAPTPSSSRPIPRPSNGDDDMRRQSPSGAWHGSQSPPSALPFAGYDIPTSSSPRRRFSGSPAGSVSGRRNSNGSRSVRSRSSRQEFWGPSDVAQRPLPTYEEQSVASGSESEDDYGEDLDELYNARELQEYHRRLAEEARRKEEEASRKEAEARRKEEEARKKQEEVWAKALEVQQKAEELARREAELLVREAEARAQEEKRKREEAEARLQEEIRRRQEVEERQAREEAQRRERDKEERERRDREEKERREREERERRDREERERMERERREREENERREERQRREQEEKERRVREQREMEERLKRQREDEARLAQEKREWEEARKREEEARAAAQAQAILEAERLRREAEEEDAAEAQALAEAEEEARKREEVRQREETRRQEAARKKEEATPRKTKAQKQREAEAQRRREDEETRHALEETESKRRREEEEAEEARRARDLEDRREEDARREREEAEAKRKQEEEAQRRREAERAAAEKASAERAAREKAAAEEAQRRLEATTKQREEEARARAAQEVQSPHDDDDDDFFMDELQDPVFLREQQAEFERIQAQRDLEARQRAAATKKREEDEARKEAQFKKDQEEIYKRIQAEEQGRIREQEARRRVEEEWRKKDAMRVKQSQAVLEKVIRASEQEHLQEQERRRKEDRRRQDSVGSGSDTNRDRAGVFYAASSSSAPRPIPTSSPAFRPTPSVPGDRSSTASSSSYSSSASFFSASSGRSNSSAHTSTSRASTTPTASATPTPKPATPSVAPGAKTGWKSTPSPATPSPTTASSTRSSGTGYHTAYGAGTSYAQSAPSTARPGTSFTASSPMSEHDWARRQEEHARKQFEQFQREQEAQQRRAEQKAIRQLSKEDVIKLFEEHERRWARLASLDVLSWHSFPWPMLKQPTDPEQLTYIEIQAYVLSPHHPGSKTSKERIKDYLRKWHPDRFETKVLPKVREDDREKVQEGAGTVARHLNKLLSSLSSSAENGLFG